MCHCVTLPLVLKRVDIFEMTVIITCTEDGHNDTAKPAKHGSGTANKHWIYSEWMWIACMSD